jgi:SDR family mycofactocin-dependent oxidoreductase
MEGGANMGAFDGRVVWITGGARGQGRSHALAFAREGANVVVSDIAAQIDSVPYPMATEADLKETQRLVEAEGRQCVAEIADSRSTADMERVVGRAIDELGQIDILIGNHGVMSTGLLHELDDEHWQDCIDVLLTGVFKACRAVVPHMIERGYGRIVNTSSVAGRVGLANISHYIAAKAGVVALTRCLAVEVAAQGITANVVCPTATNTDMIHNDANYILFDDWSGGEGERPKGPLELTQAVRDGFASINAIPISWIEPQDVSRAMLFLAHEDSRYITGAVLNVAAGAFHAAI